MWFLSLFILLLSQGLFSLETYSLTDKYGVPLDIKFINKTNIQNGFFVEVGANDGILQSNTLLLEKNYGWSGVLVEPSQIAFEKLEKNRPHTKNFHCALGSFEEHNTYIYGDFDGSSMSSVDGKRLNKPATSRVLMRSLQSIFDELNVTHVDFFSLDVEGYEFHVLKGIDFERTTFNYFLIEIYEVDYEGICSFLFEKGYELVEIFSLYDHSLPDWDGTHNDYLFKKRGI